MNTRRNKLCVLGAIACALATYAGPAFADFFDTLGTVGRVAGAVTEAQNDAAAGRPVDLGRVAEEIGKGGGKHSGGGGSHHGHSKK